MANIFVNVNREIMHENLFMDLGKLALIRREIRVQPVLHLRVSISILAGAYYVGYLALNTSKICFKKSANVNISFRIIKHQ